MGKTKKDQQLEELTDQLRRALADYSNLQKRFEEEKEKVVKFANSGLIVKLLEVLDSLEMLQKEVKNEGLYLTIKRFKDILEGESVKEIAAIDQTFDPHFHEAVDTVKGPQDDKVVEVVEKGYILGDKVLRAARVKVSKKGV